MCTNETFSFLLCNQVFPYLLGHGYCLADSGPSLHCVVLKALLPCLPTSPLIRQPIIIAARVLAHRLSLRSKGCLAIVILGQFFSPSSSLPCLLFSEKDLLSPKTCIIIIIIINNKKNVKKFHVHVPFESF